MLVKKVSEFYSEVIQKFIKFNENKERIMVLVISNCKHRWKNFIY